MLLADTDSTFMEEFNMAASFILPIEGECIVGSAILTTPEHIYLNIEHIVILHASFT